MKFTAKIRYEYILIDKNMSELKHFQNKETLLEFLYGKSYQQLLNFILIKNEKEIVNWSDLEKVAEVCDKDQNGFNTWLKIFLG